MSESGNSQIGAKSPSPTEMLVEMAEGAVGGPFSPAALAPALADVGEHIAEQPAYLMQMGGAAAEQAVRAATSSQWPNAGAEDHRFNDPAWKLPPFSLMARSFLLTEQWLNAAILHAPGVEPHHAKLAAFAARQWLDAFSPSNLLWTNPEVLRRTVEQGGANLLHGAEHLWRDIHDRAAHIDHKGPAPFVIGRDLATTPGKVVARNELMELIQYAPTTAATRPEPLLIVPAWIMKYYILDLSRERSFIRYLVERGFTVFCISWRNPGAEMAETSFEDYRRLGPAAALDVIQKITGAPKIHALGYCLGGTLLTVAAAAMARDGDDRLASACLLAAQTDFTEPGEMQVFIDEEQLEQLDKTMARQGYLDSNQLAGAFSMLRSRDLVWSHMVKSYLLGESEHPNDLMAWNADSTRLPYRMHSQYLRSMFLNNDLAAGRFEAAGGKINLAAIQTPIFAVGAEADHVAPWRSVYKLHQLCPADMTFVLASGGHNTGIVSQPGHKRASYRILHRPQGGPTIDRDAYPGAATQMPGSWWLAYADWLDALSTAPVAPPPMGAALCDAPGEYVMQR